MVIKDRVRSIDNSLATIGKHLQRLEEEYLADVDAEAKKFNAHVVPSLKTLIKNIESQVKKYDKLIKSEQKLGHEISKELIEEFKSMVEILEKSKKSLYFPNNSIIFGEGGIYLAANDIWLQSLSGKFELNLISHPEEPKLEFFLTGLNSNPGIEFCIRLEDFKLKSDDGKGIPNLSFDEVNLSMMLAIRLVLVFNYKSCSWLIGQDSIKLDIIRFEGPYGLNKGIVTTVINLLTPLIMKVLTESLPVEMGLFIRTLPSRLQVAGEFNIAGTELAHLSQAINKSILLSFLTGFFYNIAIV